MSVQTYSIQRAANIMELRNTYDDLLNEYYALYKNYLGYKFSNNKKAREITETVAATYNEVLVGKTVDPKFVNLEKVNCPTTKENPNAPLCVGSDAVELMKAKCTAFGDRCMGFTNLGELKSNGDDANLVNFSMDIGGGEKIKLYKKNTTRKKMIPPAKLAANARGKLNILKSKIDAILAELKQNIDSTDLELKDHSAIVDKKRKDILSRNKEIQKQDKDLDAINLKLVSRKRQNEFSVERNRYRKVMLVMLVIANIILLGYFAHLLTKG